MYTRNALYNEIIEFTLYIITVQCTMYIVHVTLYVRIVCTVGNVYWS